ncbi:hypothetical protein HPP92_022379 [Vanilla planifolia]|uniref:Uncharacterized protein n=1 Tax=Vanilla planifolia TaxID=51239 RepID=A0A835UD57_VANPL|nr:hypothetical protein HPP92_022379 [Vanilla planifolia]
MGGCASRPKDLNVQARRRPRLRLPPEVTNKIVEETTTELTEEVEKEKVTASIESSEPKDTQVNDAKAGREM